MNDIYDGPPWNCPICGCFMSISGTCWLGEGGGLEDNYNLKCHNKKCSERRLKDQAEDYCHADMDGECSWPGCPQLRDGEPMKSGRHCPLDHGHEDAES